MCPSCNTEISNGEKLILFFSSMECKNCNKKLRLTVETRLRSCIPIILATFIPAYFRNRAFMYCSAIICFFLAVFISLKFFSIE